MTSPATLASTMTKGGMTSSAMDAQKHTVIGKGKTMSDYIKREDAIKAVANAYWHGTDCECYAFAHKALDNAPTVDAVPVVRCRNCKYWDEHSQYGYDSDHGVYGNYCMLWTPDDDFYAVETPEDGFCYNGERKDDES